VINLQLCDTEGDSKSLDLSEPRERGIHIFLEHCTTHPCCKERKTQPKLHLPEAPKADRCWFQKGWQTGSDIISPKAGWHAFLKDIKRESIITFVIGCILNSLPHVCCSGDLANTVLDGCQEKEGKKDGFILLFFFKWPETVVSRFCQERHF